MAGSVDSSQGASILYDLLQPAEWLQDPEQPVRPVRRGFPWNLTSAAYAASVSAWSFASDPFRWPSLSTMLKRIVSQKLPWQLAMSPDGSLLAVVQEKCIEIRRTLAKDEQTSALVAKFDIPADQFCRWRHVAWNDASTVLAISSSSGLVSVYDKSGQLCASLQLDGVCKENAAASPSYGSSVGNVGSEGEVEIDTLVSGMSFYPCPSDAAGFTQLLVTTYSGRLYSYLIKSPRESSLRFSCDLQEFGVELVSAMSYVPDKNLLLVAVCCQATGSSSGGGNLGQVQSTVQAWRLLDSKPYVARSVVSNDGNIRKKSSRDFLSSVRRSRLFAGSAGSAAEKTVITAMALSPNRRLLATVDCSGRLQLLEVPSLNLIRTYSYAEEFPEEQKRPSFALSTNKKKYSAPVYSVFSDLTWWSDEAIVLATDCGHVVISSFLDAGRLHNCLGAAEVLEAYPAVASVGESSGLYALECDRQWVLPSRTVHAGGSSVGGSVDTAHSMFAMATPATDHDSEEEEEEDEEDEEDMPLVRRMTRRSTVAGKQVMYFLTENERFRTEPKQQKVLQCAYRLYSLQSRTPAELFYRRIQAEEYGEALSLADRYSLDKDVVYQSQWNTKPASPHTIQDYLAKISKHKWVIGECLNRVPDHYDTLLDLLKYGLLRTSASSVLSLSAATSLDMDKADWSSDLDGTLEHDEFGNPLLLSASERQLELERRCDKKASKLRLQVLTEEQQWMVRSRVKLLQYKDRLVTYESIMGMDKVDDKFDPEFFRSFRDANLVASALEFAQTGEWTSVDALLCRHGSTTLPHRLAILSSFPETMDPQEYRYLLPEISGDGSEVCEFVGEAQRESDWAEDLLGSSSSVDDGQFVYDSTPALAEFRGELTVPMVTRWYHQRAVQMEGLTGLVENCLKLVSLAIERHVKGLDDLHADVQTLETLVYECGHDIALKDLLAMPLSAQLELILSRAQADDSAMFVRDVRCWALPLLRNAEKRLPLLGNAEKISGHVSGSLLLGDYLVKKAKDDLRLPLAVFQNSVGSKPIIGDQADLVRIALQCMYACESEEQISLADSILRSLESAKLRLTPKHRHLLELVEQLEEHLIAAELINGYGVGTSVRAIRDVQDDVNAAERMLTKLARHVSRKSPLEYGQFRTLLVDMQTLQTGVFKCVTEPAVYKVLASALLASGIRKHLELAELLLSGSNQPMISTIRPSSAAGRRADSPRNGEPNRRGSSFPPLTYRIPFEPSVHLVIGAAREYFNSAADLADSEMALARECLSLIKVESCAVQAELDLIGAVGLLAEFKVSVLPLQVRLCEDRLSLVQDCVTAQPSSYKRSKELLQLAQLLLLPGQQEQQRQVSAAVGLSSADKGTVLMWIAHQAMQMDDVAFASQTLAKLMEVGHAAAWELCQTLGMDEGNEDLSFRRHLLSFAITYCPAAAMESLLDSIHLLEATMLLSDAAGRSSSYGPQSALSTMQSVLGSTGDASMAMVGTATSAVSSFVSLGTGAVTQMVTAGNESVVASSLSSTGALVAESVVGKSAGEMMSLCNSWMQSATSYWSNSSLSSAATSSGDVSTTSSGHGAASQRPGQEDDVLSMRCHPFYADVFPPNVADHSVFSYSSLTQEPVLPASQHFALKQNLLRTCKITEEVNKTIVDQDEMMEVLLRLAAECVHRDTTLSLAYLLALPKVESASVVFDRLPPCRLTYQLAILYYSLHLHARAHTMYKAELAANRDTSQDANEAPSTSASSSKPKKGNRSSKRQAGGLASSQRASSSQPPLQFLSDPYSRQPEEFCRWLSEYGDGLRSRVSAVADGGEVMPPPSSSAAGDADSAVGGGGGVVKVWSPEEFELLFENGRRYQDRLSDLIQAGVLHTLDAGIDASRFSLDAEYKTEVILSLARRLDATAMQTALSLSTRYSLGAWPVYMARLVYLFNDSALPWSEIHSLCHDKAAGDGGESLAGQSIVDHLLEKSEAFAEHLRVEVFPSLSGTDHSRLLLYYDLLQAAVATGAEDESPISVQQHIKLLKKLKAGAPGMDYKGLVYGAAPLDAVQPVVLASNVHVIAKIVAKLPVAGGVLTSSRVFCTFCTKLFWEPGKKKESMGAKDWVHRYEAAQEYLGKLSPSDLVQFCKSMTHSPQSYRRLPVESRLEICRRCAKQCRQLSSSGQSGQGKKQRALSTSASLDQSLPANSDFSFEMAFQQLQTCLQHLETLQSEAVQRLASLDEELTTEYHMLYSCSAAEPDKVVRLCTSLLSDGVALSIVDSVLKVAESVCPHGTYARRLINQLINDILENISLHRDDKEVASALLVLSRVLSSISQDLESGHSSVKSADVVERLRTFCTRSELRMSSRLAVLQLLEKLFCLSEEDESLLLFCNTSALTSQFWDIQLDVDRVAGEQGRRMLFSELLLQSADNAVRLVGLAELLRIWPPLRDSSGVSTWSVLFQQVIEVCGQDGVEQVVKHRAAISTHHQNPADDALVLDKLLDCSFVTAAVKYCIISQQPELADRVGGLLMQHKLDIAEHDTSLSQLLLSHSLAAVVVPTPYFATFQRHAVQIRAESEAVEETDSAPRLPRTDASTDTASSAVGDLCAADKPVEAGSMLLSLRGTAAALATFDASVSLVSQWWNGDKTQ